MNIVGGRPGECLADQSACTVALLNRVLDPRGASIPS